MPAKLTREQFIERAIQAHAATPEKYSYEQSIYCNNLTPITILCREHGPFQQRPAHHMDGHGCPRCKSEATSKRCSDDTDAFIAKARTIHGDTFDYSRVLYHRSNRKVEIICREHGAFWQTPNAHLSRQAGCPKCAGKSRSTADFVAQASTVHGGRYTYDRTHFSLIKDKLIITCPVHGDFEQVAEAHLIGRGCRYCWYEATTSQGEQEVAAWIKSLGFQLARNRRDLLPLPMEIDIYLPEHKVGIEFNGCYWHSDKYQKNTRQHEFKHRQARKAGVRLITVWDYDWRHRQEVVQQHLRHALGLTEGIRYGARTCNVVTLSAPSAQQLYQQHHLQGAVRGGVIHLGLAIDGRLLAAMSFTQGATRRGKTAEGEWELARYATAALVPGGANRLFHAFIAQYHPDVVWSFSDHQHFSGALYPRLGFTHDGEIPADYRVVHPSSLRTWHKSLWQRKSIPARLRELQKPDAFNPATDPRTEREMQDLAGVLRVWDAGKTRWVWRR
jgi:G:T-mismatch repair DNA endonuclease (very short patch repair protein)